MYSIKLHNLDSDGSALLQSGGTTVQASVWGPLDIKISKELHDKAAIEVSYKIKCGKSDYNVKSMEYFIKSSIEAAILTTLHPRTSIKIVIEEIQNAGNIVACAANAAYLALLDAGIALNGTLAAVSVGLFDDKVIPFPSEKEIKNAKCVTTIWVKNSGEYILGTKCSSFLEEEDFRKCVAVAKETSEDLSKFFKEFMLKRCLKISKCGKHLYEEDN